MWQALQDELGAEGFRVVAVALDSRDDAARPFIEAANPGYPCLIDRDHRVAQLYHMVNVPQAVWIDEEGRIVRPTETAGADEGFRKMNRDTFQMPEEAVARTQKIREVYLDSIRDWVRNGSQSEFVYSSEQRALTSPDRATTSRGRTRASDSGSTWSERDAVPRGAASSRRRSACSRRAGASGVSMRNPA